MRSMVVGFGPQALRLQPPPHHHRLRRLSPSPSRGGMGYRFTRVTCPILRPGRWLLP
jgi:hypothetical protein